MQGKRGFDPRPSMWFENKLHQAIMFGFLKGSLNNCFYKYE